MSQVYEATFDGEVFKPLDHVKLPKNTRVQLIVSIESQGNTASFLDVAESLELEGPSDWSVRVDDYLTNQT